MKLTTAELEFLSAWAREEWEPECYRQPAHRQQLEHGVVGAHLIDLIKVWTISEGKKDQDIVQASANSQPAWPWGSAEAFRSRWQEAAERAACPST